MTNVRRPASFSAGLLLATAAALFHFQLSSTGRKGSQVLFGCAALSFTSTTTRMSAAAVAATETSGHGSPPRNIVVIGGGIQGSSCAYHISKSPSLPAGAKITVLEAKELASAASGKGGGFMARSWGNGGPTQRLHELAFDMYESLSQDLGCETYRKLPVLSVQPGKNGVEGFRASSANKSVLPGWLDGNVGRLSILGAGDDTAQVTPSEFTNKFVERSGADVLLGTCTGIATEAASDGGNNVRVTGVKYIPRGSQGEKGGEETIPCDAVVVSAGPWSCAAEDWFKGAVSLPMEGIKSTSIVWKAPEGADGVDATALFCGEDNRFGTHLEVYPRPDGSIYLCGIGGSDYIPKAELMAGAYREECEANPSRVEAASDSFKEMSAEYRQKGELDRVQACMRPCPPDALPYMGKVPGYEGAFINAGHNCWGIAWAPACGKAMAELVLDGACSSVNLKPFDPTRFNPAGARGGRGRKRRGTDVGEQW